MAVICPTVTAETIEDYNKQLTTNEQFAARIHIDVADGQFAPRQLLSLGQVHFPPELETDIHIMVTDPAQYVMTLISLQPSLVIIHAESQGDLRAIIDELHKVDIKVGVALLPDTKVKTAANLLPYVDHALIFAGNLGYQGGEADMSQIYKVDEIRAVNHNIELAWDGGVNDQNAAQLAQGGIDVLNVGGFIQNAADPAEAYRQLTAIVNK